mgnify:CR=1 FL=1
MVDLRDLRERFRLFFRMNTYKHLTIVLDQLHNSSMTSTTTTNLTFNPNNSSFCQNESLPFKYSGAIAEVSLILL